MELNSADLFKKKEEGWVAILGQVYDVSEFVDQHPGGSDVIEEWYGKDATNAFLEIHPSGLKKLLNTWGDEGINLYWRGAMKVDAPSNDYKKLYRFLYKGNREENYMLLLIFGFLFISIIRLLYGHYISAFVLFMVGLELIFMNYKIIDLPDELKIKVKNE